MRTALDSNILSALWSREPDAPVISRMLKKARAEGGLVLSPIAYTELFACPNATGAFIEDFLREERIGVDFDLAPSVWSEAGRRFAAYALRRRRSKGGQARRLPADFLVGAHALQRATRLMTKDLDRYERDFPDLHLQFVGE